MAARSKDRQYQFLMEILREEEQISPFLDVIFEFLYERTDFYRDFDDTKGKSGFKAGVAEKLVLNHFHKYQKRAQKDAERQKLLVQDVDKQMSSVEINDLTNVAVEVEVQSENSSVKPFDTSEKEKAEDDKRKIKPAVRQIESDSYNGAVLDNYKWSQSINDVDVRIPVPNYITSSKMVRVEFNHKHLKTSINSNKEWKVVVDGEFTRKINLEKSMWTFVPGEHIHVNIEKFEERWWDSLLVGDPKIDVTQIESTKAIEDLPEEEQAQLEELVYNEQQTRMGKPTSKEKKIHDMMKEAWDKPGSPFQGQAFDPSLYNVQGSLN